MYYQLPETHSFHFKSLQVKAIKDGSGTTTITESMKELHNATDNIALFGGDLRTAVDTLDDTAIASNATDGAFDTEQKQVEEIDVISYCFTLVFETVIIWNNALNANDKK